MVRYIRLFLRRVLQWIGEVPTPGKIKLVTVKEICGMLRFDVMLPTDDDLTDVVGGELTITSTLNGVESTNTIQTSLGQESVTGFMGDQDSQVNLIFCYLDDAGNKSKTPVTLSDVLTDTFAPADPGSLGISVTGEE